MHEKSYSFNLLPGEPVYQFESTSANKRIQKFVFLTPTKDRGIFNLALVDLTENGEFTDQTESNNGDLVVVFATVFRIIEHFLNNNPDYIVMFKGNDERRHRLYRIALSRELPAISERFRVYGGTPGNFGPFKANEDYDFYFIKTKLT